MNPIILVFFLIFKNKFNVIPKTKKALYMDQFSANCIEYSTTAKMVKTIKSNFKNQEKREILITGENHLQNEFYVKLKEELLNYKKVLLFGSPNAKNEFETIITNN
jgi:hypothetical protein